MTGLMDAGLGPSWRVARQVAPPDLVDVETVAVLRKRWLAGTLSERRFTTAMGDLEAIELDR